MGRKPGAESPRVPGSADAPRVLRITPEGRRVVDPMSIIGSESAKKHLEEIAKVRAPEGDKSEPAAT